MKIHRFAAAVTAALLCLLSVAPLAAQNTASEPPAALARSLDYLKEHPGEWTPLAQNASGATTGEAHAREIKCSASKSAEPSSPSAFDLAQDILRVSAVGYDASTLDGRSLIDALTIRADMLSRGADGPVFSLLALDCRSYEPPANAVWNRDALCRAILSFQTADGGFCPQNGAAADIPTTAYALTALSRYAEQPDIAAAVARATDWLARQQNNDATFSSLGKPDSEATSAVVTALISLGIPVLGERFAKDGVTVYDALLSFENPGGGFSPALGTSPTVPATEKAVMAMGSVFFGKSAFRFAEVTPPAEHTGFAYIYLLPAAGFVMLCAVALLLVRRRRKGGAVRKRK